MRSTVLVFTVVAMCLVASAFGQMLQKRAAPGSLSDLDESEWPSVNESITDSFLQLKEEQSEHYELIKILSVKQQAVAGWRYVITALIKKHGDSDEITCNLDIVEQSWLKYRSTDIKCGDKSFSVVKGKQEE